MAGAVAARAFAPAAPLTAVEPLVDRTDYRRTVAVLLLAGFNLALVHYTVIREMGALIGANQVVALLVMVAYFLGLSFGYLISHSLSRTGITVLGLATVALHATLPFSARWVAGSFARIGLDGNVPPFVFLLVMLGITPFYALFLPRLLAEGRRGDQITMGRWYALELGGTLLGVIAVVAISPARISWLLTLHLLGVIALVWLQLPGRRWWWAPLWLIPVGYAFRFQDADRSSLEYFYQWSKGVTDPTIVASELSPYQRVDIIEHGDPDERGRSLYLDGILFYGTWRLNQHNLFVTILPNLGVRKTPSQRALVIGGGSLDCVRHLGGKIPDLNVVELDPTVVQLTEQHLQAQQGELPGPWNLVIDDAKHYLATDRGARYDAISVDVPVPTHVQTAMIHSQEFFRLARSRLTDDGIFSISLSGKLRDRSPEDHRVLKSRLANRVVAGLRAEFRYVRVIDAEGWSYAWASESPLDLSERQLARNLRRILEDADGALGKHDAPRFRDSDDVEDASDGFEPIAMTDMQLAFRVSLRKLFYRYYDGD